MMPAPKSGTLFRYIFPDKFSGLPTFCHYTGGVRSLALDNAAFWVIDHIMSVQTFQGVVLSDSRDLQFWKIAKDGNGAIVRMSSEDGAEIYSEKFLFTDLFEFYDGEELNFVFEQGVLMLPNER